MRQVSTGLGLCVLGLCIVAYPLVDRLGTRAEAGIPSGAVAVASLAQGPPEQTVVWYQATQYRNYSVLWRAWSGGRVEIKRVMPWYGDTQDWCGFSPEYPCATNWFVVSDPAQGLTFDADLNFDQAVDGIDLGLFLAKWGPAPRNPVPPSDCPLALINP